MDAIKTKNVEVGGDKIISAERKVNTDGYFVDKFGNKIYITNSEANKNRQTGNV